MITGDRLKGKCMNGYIRHNLWSRLKNDEQHSDETRNAKEFKTVVNEFMCSERENRRHTLKLELEVFNISSEDLCFAFLQL